MSGQALRMGKPAEAARVYDDAFAHYPVMRFVLATEEPYAERITALHDMWAQEAELHGYMILVVEADGLVAAAATVVEPGTPTESSAYDEAVRQVWEGLGAATEARYDAYRDAARAVHSPRPGMYLDMLGVMSAAQGMGLARLLLEEVQARSAANPASEGVFLTTENPVNVAFYERFGYEVIAHVRVSDTLETWGFFRPDDVSS